ncbi:MAG TPA: BamA/TamA family outer membrane protein [bacterium]|nr:BamA/TamA family outer membrane protein [bacterium]HNT64296.1 BamA/TamA family outer membrane protein [bacterium]HOX85286.1 BamA/TamA family outer membrane protein [bacterium]HPG44445.1 BamA/TamA family outer membrane protein [bacterium]HPM97003.1 BamA/TamA family outer membrane protein [bacterium]
MLYRMLTIGCFLLQSLFPALVARADGGSPQTKLLLHEIRFHGLQQTGSEQAMKWMEMRLSQPVLVEELPQKIEKLLTGLAGERRVYSRVDSLVYKVSSDSALIELDVYLFEAPRLHLQELSISGADSSQIDDLKARFDTRPGGAADAQTLEADLLDAADRLASRGYAFSRFDLVKSTLATENFEQAGLVLGFNLALGPALVIQDIQIIGNTLTKKEVILREARLRPGMSFNQKTVDRAVSRLMRTGYFRQVLPPVVFLSEGDQGGLLLTVEEGTTSRFDGILGYTPGVENESGYFTGLLDISLGNLLGTGRFLAAHWQKRDRKTQELEFRYREPWIAGLPVSIGFGFEQLIQDTTYVDRAIDLDLDLPLLENLVGSAGISRRDVSPDSLGSALLGLPKSRTWTAKLGFALDTRDDLVNPRTGFYYHSSGEVGKKKNLGPENLLAELNLAQDVDIKRFTLDVEWYVPLFKRQLVALSLHGRQLKSNENPIPLPDLFRLGGAKSMRGYREDQFLGSSVVWSNLEFRYWLGRRSRVFVFLDGGYYSRTAQNVRTEAFRSGYGLGFRLQTGLGVMGIDYGLGKGDDLMNGKLHISLINEF